MRLIIRVIAGALALSGQTAVGASPHNANADAAEIKATINALLAGVAAHDGAAMLATIRSDGIATVAAEKPDGTLILRHPSWADFAASAKPGPQRFEPRLKNSMIKIDGNIAMAWTPYTFSIDGKLHHCGTNHFDLVKENGSWKILNVTYSYRTTDCRS